MMFSQEQLDILKSDLDSNRVKHRSKGNINLSYIEGHDALETANKVFGFGNWDYAVSKLEQVSQEVNQNQNNVVCYKAVVQISVYSENHLQHISREDVGFGTGTSKILADAHEGGAKEAVTDALKRALRSFGNQFGNSLYDKSKNQCNKPLNSNVPTTTPKTNQYNVQQQNMNQQNNQMQSQSQNQNHPNHAYDPYEYQSLYNIGLDVIKQQGFLLVTGDDIFSKKDSIKACGFRWDSKTKQWYKQLEQGAA